MLFLADAVFSDLPGGSRMVARELATGLALRGYEVTFLVARQIPDTPSDEQNGAIRIVRYDGAGKGAEFIRNGRSACAKLYAENSFDLVHTHFAYAAIGPLGAVPKSVPRIRTFHGPWDEEGWLEDNRTKHPLSLVKAATKRKMRYFVEKISLQESAAVLTLSNCFAQKVLTSYGVSKDKVTVIPGGTDTKRFCLEPDRAAVRERLGLAQGRRILFTVRRLAPRMGLENLVKAMSAVAADHPDVLLLIGGKGPERDNLKALITQRRLEANVHLLGFIPDADLAAHYQASNLFVLPTIALEGFGLVITEALACGVPVIGTPVGAIPEILNGLDPRLVAASVEPSALANAIKDALEGEWANGLSPQRLRKHVEELYTWNGHTDAVERVYRRILGCKAETHNS